MSDNYNHDPKHFRELANKRPRQIKTCPICGTGFDGLKVQVFCSAKCRKANARKKADQAKRGEHFGGVE